MVIRRGRRSFLLFAGGLVLAAACGSDGRNNGTSKGASRASGSQAAQGSAPLGGAREPVKLRLGYFPNITHAQPQVALQRGTYADALGAGVQLDMSRSFNAGPTAMEALLAGAIDATFVGPSPTLNAFVQSEGKELRIVAGATSGGALLVVRAAANLTKPGDFTNKKIATPQLGNTQDVALRAWLRSNGLNAKENGGNVSVLPTANPDTLSLFKKGDIDGAWVPEPWATRLIQEADGKVYLDERTLWPNGQFVTTHLVVRTSYLQRNPDVVERLVRGHVETTEWIKANAEEAKRLVNENITKVTGAGLAQAVIDAAWANQDITYDPVAASLGKNADDAFKLGFFDKKPNLSNIYDLTLLNTVLKDRNQPEVKGLA